MASPGRRFLMSPFGFGIMAGIIFGAIAVGMRLPRAALSAAFTSRFAIGVFAATSQLPMPPWARGLVVGLLVSLPDALVTKACAPILIIGSIGGLLIGIAAARWAA
jgi:hypothetical protein